MSFGRKFLSAMGIEADKVDQIIEAHVEVTDALKAERDKYKQDAEKLPGVQEELDKLKAAQPEDGKNPWKVKYDALKEDFEDYKNQQSAKETKAQKEAAYKALLQKAGVSEKRIAAVLKVTDLDGIELDKNGEIKDAEKHEQSIREEWADFIPTVRSQGANTATPPQSIGSTVSREEIYRKDDSGRFVHDASERQQMLMQLQKG